MKKNIAVEARFPHFKRSGRTRRTENHVERARVSLTRLTPIVTRAIVLVTMLAMSTWASTSVFGIEWDEEQLILPPSGEAFDHINAIVIENDWMIVPVGDSVYGSGDVVFVYQRINGAWNLHQSLLPDAVGEGFGAGISISGDTLAIGAWTASDAAVEGGAVYFFRNIAGVWTFEDKRTPSDPLAGSKFGADVVVQGDIAVVGAKEYESKTGAAYVFYRSGSQWSQIQKLTPSDGMPGLAFGRDVALDGARIVVSAHYAVQGVTGGVGGAYVYEPDGQGIWIETSIVRPNNVQATDKFGTNVVIEDDLLIVTAHETDGSFAKVGSVYFFRFDGVDWVLQQIVQSLAPYERQRFGRSLAIDNGTVVVASTESYLRTTGETRDIGKVHILQEVNGVWQIVDESDNPFPETTKDYGTYKGLDISLDTIAVYWSGYEPDGAVRTLLPFSVPASRLVTVDSSADDSFEYAPNGDWLANYPLGSGNNSPKGATADTTGYRWVIDNDDYVYVYDPIGMKIGAWKANGLSRPEGIATDGIHLWIVDRGTDSVYYFANGTSLTSGSVSATSTIKLKTSKGNKAPYGIFTDGKTFLKLA